MDLCLIDVNKLKIIGRGVMGSVYLMQSGSKRGDGDRSADRGGVLGGDLDEDKALKEYIVFGYNTTHDKRMWTIIRGIAMREIKSLVKASKVIAKGLTDGFPLLYDFAKCKRYADDTNKSSDVTAESYRMLLKYYHYKPNDILNSSVGSDSVGGDGVGGDDEKWLAFMLQLRFDIEIMHREMHIVHRDIDINNIMLDKVDDLDGYYKYDFGNGKVFYVQGWGYKPVIIDFGKSLDTDDLNEKERRKKERDDFSFFFYNKCSGVAYMDGYMFRKDDMRESIYMNFNVEQIVSKLGKDNGVVQKSIKDTKKYMQTYREGNKDNKFLRKLLHLLSIKIGKNVNLYKQFDPELKFIIHKTKRPKGIINEFFSRFNHGGWTKENVTGKMIRSYQL